MKGGKNMGYIIGLGSLLLGGVGYLIYKNILNPVSFFLFLWGPVCILSQLKLFEFTGASDYAYFLIGIGIISYSVGGFLLLKAKKPLRFRIGGLSTQSNVIKREKVFLNRKLLWIMMFLVFIYTIYKLKLALPFILENNTLGYVRAIYLRVGAGITINAFDYLINTFLIAGMRITCEIVIINEVISRRKIHPVLIIMLGLVIIMNVLLTGGRMILLDLCLFIFFGIKLNDFKTKYKLNFWQKIVVTILIIVLVYGLLYITKDRQSSNSIMESIYGNFIGGVSLFSTVVNEVLKNKWTYGVMFFYGILSLVWAPLNYFFNLPYPKGFETFNTLVSPFYSVGGTTMNAYITCWAFFYSDYGILGIIIFSMIFGLLMGDYYNKFREIHSPEYICKYMLMLNIIFYTIIRWQLSSSSYLLAIFLLSIIYKKSIS